MTVITLAAILSGGLLVYSVARPMRDLINARRQRTRGRLDQELRRQTQRIRRAVRVFDVLDEDRPQPREEADTAALPWYHRGLSAVRRAGIHVGPRQLLVAWFGIALGSGVVAYGWTHDEVLAGLVANGLAGVPLIVLLIAGVRRLVRHRHHAPTASVRFLRAIRNGQSLASCAAGLIDELFNGPRWPAEEHAAAPERTEVELSDDDQWARVIEGQPLSITAESETPVPNLPHSPLPGGDHDRLVARLADDGTLVSIRRIRSSSLVIDDLLRGGVLTSEMMKFLLHCVRARINLLICGVPGAGKRTLLNVLSHFIPPDERVAVMEQGDELRLAPLNVVSLEARPPLFAMAAGTPDDGATERCLEAAPQRLIATECGGPELPSVLRALGSSCQGSLVTLDARSPRDAIARLEMMVAATGDEASHLEARRQIVKALDVMVQISRLNGSVHRVTRITELSGMEGDTLALRNIFEFVQTGLDEQGAARGYFRTTGIHPLCLERLSQSGAGLDESLFERRELEPLILGGGKDL